MKRFIPLLLILPSFAMANGPKYSYRDNAKLDDEIRNLYHDIRNAKTADPLTLSSATITNLYVTTATITNYGIPIFVDRGDPAAADKNSSWTTSGAWTDLDLSAIVPEGAKAVLLRIRFQTTAVGGGDYFAFRKNGNSNVYNSCTLATQIANVWQSAECIVPLDAGRTVEYMISMSGSLGLAEATVRGWWK